MEAADWKPLNIDAASHLPIGEVLLWKSLQIRKNKLEQEAIDKIRNVKRL